MSDNILKQLLEIGFTKNQAVIYLWLLDNDHAKAGAVISGTSLQRSVVYEGLAELENRGLVSKTVRRGVFTYSVNELGALVHEIEQKKEIAALIVRELEHERHRKGRTASILEGLDIIPRIANKSLELAKGETVYFLGPSKFGVQAHLERYWSSYHEKRSEAGINCKILYDRATDESIVEKRNRTPLCEARYLPFGEDLPMSYIIAGDTASMIVPAENPPLAFVLKSKPTSEALIKYFDYLWQQA